MITLHNMIDIRTGQFYSVVVIKESNRKWFIYARKQDSEVEDEME